MSIKKVALSFALAGILGATYAVAETDGVLGATTAVAETDGAFIGVQVGYGGLKSNIDVTRITTTQRKITRNSEILPVSNYGIVAGYKQFFIPEFGLRYYASFDFGYAYSGVMENGLRNSLDPQRYKVITMNFDANVDMLYNFVSIPNVDFGAFLGMGLGYVNYTFKKVKMKGGRASVTGFEDFKMGGFDLGINFGLRTNIAQNHGIELYSRFGLLKYKKDYVLSLAGGTLKYEQNFKVRQPYQVGLRYTYSF